MRQPAAAAAAALLLASVGCASVRQHFVSNDDLLPRVALTIGDERVVGKDTTYVLRGPGYTLEAPSREVLADLRPTLDASARSFQRYFASEPPTLPVVARRVRPRPPEDQRDRDDRAHPRGDSAAAPDSAEREETAPHDSTVVIPLPSHAPESGGYGGPGGYDRGAMGASMLAMRAAGIVTRAWLSEYARRGAGGWPTPPSAARAAADSTHPRGLPAWLDIGIASLLNPSPAQDVAIIQLARTKQWIPIRALLDTAPPRGRASRAAGGEPGTMMAGPGGEMRRGDDQGGRVYGRRPDRTAMERAMLLPAQSQALARLIATKEGPAFIGRLADRLLAGVAIEEVLRDTKVLPHDLAGLEAALHTYVAQIAADVPQGRGPG